MAQREIDHLLEAFAADTLTPEERRRLLAAAMRDQCLLSAMADEQALKEELRDPALRARLLWELETGGGTGRNDNRWWRHPWMWTAIFSAVAAAVTIVIGTQLYQGHISEQPPTVEREDSALITPAEPSIPGSDVAEPAPNDDATSPPAIFNKPETDRPATRRIPAPFKGPIVEERVRDDEISAPTTVLRKQERDQAASKKYDLSVRSKTVPPAYAKQAPNTQPTVHDDAMALHPAVPVSPARQQAAMSVPAAPRTSAPQPSARTLFYGEANHLASAAALNFSESDQASHPEMEQKPLVPSALSVPPPLAVRYSLVIEGSDGTHQEVGPETPVRVSDRPRLAVQTNQDGYLLVTELSSASETAIVPTAAAKPVQARTTMIFPLAGLITDPAADPVLRLRLTFARQSLDPKQLLTRTPAPTLEERVEPAPERPAEHAVYAAAPAKSDPPLLTVELALHQLP